MLHFDNILLITVASHKNMKLLSVYRKSAISDVYLYILLFG